MYRPRMTAGLASSKNVNGVTETAESGSAWNGKSSARDGSRQQRGELDLQTDSSHQGDVVKDEAVIRDLFGRTGKRLTTDESSEPG